MGFSSSVWFFLAVTTVISMILPTDKKRSFDLTGGRKDCQRCFDGCKTRCDGIGARAADQICLRRFVIATNAFLGLVCTCCCRERTPLPPPPPPLDLFGPPPPPLDIFGPPPPPPSTPTSDTNNICSLRDIYIAFHQFDDPRDCIACATECENKCSAMGTTYSVAEERCSVGSSSTECKCCCENNTSPPPPPPPSPPPPAPVALPPSPAPAPPPPPNTMCAAGERYIAIQFSDTTSCRTCATDCQRRCSTLLDGLLGTSSLSSQRCKLDASSSSELCECCCR
ncbi:hypothetical protein MKW92_031939 [Papaver armeniacum]|nr:hypothetical protein MKW92_031939 [Papaver armeniacum]